MTTALAAKAYCTPEEYLTLENKSHEKHELINEEMVAMAGASAAHVIVSGNVFAAVKSHLRGKAC